MKPYWQSADGSIVIYHGDMRELCASLRADAVVTDAPFGIADAPLKLGKGNGRRCGRQRSQGRHRADSLSRPLRMGPRP